MRPLLSRLIVLIVAAVAVAACSTATSAAPTVNAAWARPAAAGGQSAAYFTITNPSTTADSLVSASSPGASTVDVHETNVDGAGMSAMHPVERVDIPAGQSVVFKPGSYHLMLMGLTDALTVGGTIELDLVFEHAGKVVVQAPIRQG
jgi:copper(I)-binding protein